METSAFVDAVRQTVSPAMTDRGFQPTGPGWSADGRVSFVYCTGARTFASRWPRTVDAIRTKTSVDLREPSHCLDLIVEASRGGEIVRLDLEGVELDVLLEAAHLDDLAHRCSAEELRGLDATASAARIRDAVDALMPLAPGN